MIIRKQGRREVQPYFPQKNKETRQKFWENNIKKTLGYVNHLGKMRT
jgi:hypothetical protein